VNGVTFVIFCITLLVPLAILWFFLVKNMIEIYRNDFNKPSPPPTPTPMTHNNYPGCYPHNQGMPMEELASPMPAPAASDPSYGFAPPPPQHWQPQEMARSQNDGFKPPSYDVSQARHGTAAGAEPNRNRNGSEKAAPSKGSRAAMPPSKKPKARAATAEAGASKKPK